MTTLKSIRAIIGKTTNDVYVDADLIASFTKGNLQRSAMMATIVHLQSNLFGTEIVVCFDGHRDGEREKIESLLRGFNLVTV